MAWQESEYLQRLQATYNMTEADLQVSVPPPLPLWQAVQRRRPVGAEPGSQGARGYAYAGRERGVPATLPVRVRLTTTPLPLCIILACTQDLAQKLGYTLDSAAGGGHGGWGYMNTQTLLFSFSILSTIGYGNITPTTPGGKLFVTCFLVPVGVPIGVLCECQCRWDEDAHV
eukprot:COSAG01_NODE_10786_length_2080_cov_12.465422_4_plen_172_part_00